MDPHKGLPETALVETPTNNTQLTSVPTQTKYFTEPSTPASTTTSNSHLPVSPTLPRTLLLKLLADQRTHQSYLQRIGTQRPPYTSLTLQSFTPPLTKPINLIMRYATTSHGPSTTPTSGSKRLSPKNTNLNQKKTKRRLHLSPPQSTTSLKK